jgi:hypothetical protein
MAVTSRDTILQSLRATNWNRSNCRIWINPGAGSPIPVAQFAEVLEAVGGRCLCAANLQEVNHQLSQLPAFQASSPDRFLRSWHRPTSIRM